MNTVLLVFLSLSVSGSMLALLMLALRPAVKNRLSQTWQYYVWLIVILRFLLPFTPPVSVVGEMAHRIENLGTPVVVVEPGGALDLSELPGADDAVDPSGVYGGGFASPAPDGSHGGQTPDMQTAQADDAEKPAVSAAWRNLRDNAWLFWLGVALVLFVHKVASYRSFVRFVNVGTKMVKDGQLAEAYKEVLAEKGLEELPLYLNEQVSSPMLVGMFRPKIIIPPLAAGDEELKSIFRHELTHYRRRDFLYKWLVQITLCLHWFNPLIYVISKQISRCCELSCDEAVIRRLPEESRMTYGDALITSLEAQGSYSDFVVSITMSENARLVKERLDAIMKYKEKTKATALLACLLSLLFVGGYAFTGAYALAPGVGPGEITAVPQHTRAQSYVVECETENIFVRQEGNEFLVELDPETAASYTLTDNTAIPVGERHYRYNKWDVVFGRADRQNTSAAYASAVTITVPEDAKQLLVRTGSGSIQIVGLEQISLTVQSESGNIYLTDTAVEYLSVESVRGNMELVGITSQSDIDICSELEGTVFLQMDDAAGEYAVEVDTLPDTSITIGGESYAGGDYLIGSGRGKTITLEGLNSTFIISNVKLEEASQTENEVTPRQNSTGTRRAPDDIPTVTARADSFTTVEKPNLKISVDNNAAVDLVPISSEELTVEYGRSLYDVSVVNENGNWEVYIIYTGGYSIYPSAVVYVPDIVYGDVDLQIEEATFYFSRVFRKGGDINANIRDSSVFCTIPAGFKGTMNIAAPNCYFELDSEDGYQDCAVTIANGVTYGQIADGFTKRGSSFVYAHGTQAGTVSVDMQNRGYVTIE